MCGGPGGGRVVAMRTDRSASHALVNHLRHNLVAWVALFVALGGAGAYAAGALPKNSVGAKQLKRNAVTAKKVKDGSLLAGDFAPGQLPEGKRGATGERGPAGPQGERGIQGERGEQGIEGKQGTTG